MNRLIKTVLSVCVIISLIIFGIIRFSTHQFIQKLPDWISDFSGPFATVRVGSVQQADCPFLICAHIQNLTIQPAGYKPLTIPSTFIAIPIKWPIRIHIQTPEESPIRINADFSNTRWSIQQLSGQIDSFRFSIKGDIQTTENQGFLTLQTTGLYQFIRYFIQMPNWMKFIIRDTPQELKLVPQSDYLRLYGFPLIPLK